MKLIKKYLHSTVSHVITYCFICWNHHCWIPQFERICWSIWLSELQTHETNLRDM